MIWPSRHAWSTVPTNFYAHVEVTGFISAASAARFRVSHVEGRQKAVPRAVRFPRPARRDAWAATARGRRAVRALALVAAVSFVLLLALIVATAVRHGAPYPPDAAAHRWVLAHRASALVDAAVVVTESGTGLAAYGLAALGGALAARRAWWQGAAAGVVILGLGQLVRIALASGIGRRRPPAADWAWTAGGPAMPSGHTTTSAIVAVVLTVGIARRFHGRGRLPMLAVPGLWALGVGATRVYLGMHWVTDVVAGWLLALVWTALLGLLLVHRRRRTAGTASTSTHPKDETT